MELRTGLYEPGAFCRQAQETRAIALSPDKTHETTEAKKEM